MNKSIYIIGSKGIPAKYGGFETFVEKLTENKVDTNIQYYVACLEENSIKSEIYEEHFEYNGAKCFNVRVPNVGPAKAVLYDILALKKAIEISIKNNDTDPVFYVLACRIGPFIQYFKKKIERINGQLFINPDGHEWLRQKWSLPVRKYWKFSERLMVKNADLLICDSLNIEKYILSEYHKYDPTTTYIAYGTDLNTSSLTYNSVSVRNWFSEKKISEKNYYLIVGRFVPENNYEIVIKEFMKTNINKDLVLITDFSNNKFYLELQKRTNFMQDKRIKFVGTVYDQNLLKYIRENAYGYLHGHEVGGTNPSLLEALSSTELNLLINVKFNKEVAGDSALYWNKSDDNLKNVLEESEKIDLKMFGDRAKYRISNFYRWEKIVNDYEQKFK
ncbi:glycosyl transferase [Enterococcus casseliflavus]|uniref:beta 1-4 rhamnosyltransferase Cps2T n=1 Tax=Enterococcus casseliflavus TaxID=37734 RepID=UPI0009C048E7|nr:DUF1972 domain-containing protein [Enterococcus casseliflavus]OQO83704.1 glycosyl transferase [Enterococcus casseliflavus]